MKKEIRIHPSPDQQPPENKREQINCANELGIKTNQKLTNEGWQRRSLVDPARAAEFTELYESLGYEVLAQNLTPEDFAETCKDCASTACGTYLLLYTRIKQNST